jgi:hypothetical protein
LPVPPVASTVCGAAEGFHMIRLLVEDVGAVAAAVGQAEFGAGDEIDGDVVLEHLRCSDVRAQFLRQGVLHCRTGGVGDMDDPSVAVPAFAGEVIAVAGIVPGKWHALADEPVDGRLAPLDDEAGNRGLHRPAPATRVSLMWASIESASSSAAAMPPWARLLALSSSRRLVTRATFLCGASWSASAWPARPLPMIRTSKTCTELTGD